MDIEARDAIIGFDASSCLLFVVHVQIEDECIRIISARRATNEERRDYEHS
ncbi:MAG: BrnT family toxin [Thiobacillus sp.]|nr:BrnT family toxin [Thiobacillus sp.]